MVFMFFLCISVNIGMWFERFVIIVTSLTRSFNPANWFYYKMSLTEVMLIVGSFAWFFMFFLVFVRVLPAFSIAEIKETLPAPRRRDHA
jgi:molybdopterin-containing oxidoreductase family membrane subunit